MTTRHAEGTFTVAGFTPVDITQLVAVTTAMDTGVATMEKQYEGGVVGRSATLFTSARNAETGAGSYLALESFDGTLDDLSGSFNFTHAASTHGEDRYGESLAIVESSGTGDLAGIRGGGGLTVDPDGTHRVWFDYELG